MTGYRTPELSEAGLTRLLAMVAPDAMLCAGEGSSPHAASVTGTIAGSVPASPSRDAPGPGTIITVRPAEVEHDDLVFDGHRWTRVADVVMASNLAGPRWVILDIDSQVICSLTLDGAVQVIRPDRADLTPPYGISRP